jgi:alkylhydroperoxidase family enzyme
MEIAVCYVAVLNNATYEWTAHAPLALKAGVRPEALEAVLKGDVKNSSVLTEAEIDVLEFTYQSTKNITIDDNLMEKLKARYTDQQVMELTITVGSYNMVSRFLVALDVTESNGKELKMPE